MNAADVVYTNLERIIGLPENELRAMPDLNLVEEELIDSLSMAELLSAVGNDLGHKLDLKKFKTKDFTTIGGIIAAVEAQLIK